MLQTKFDELMARNEFLNKVNLKINKFMPSLLFFSLILVLIIGVVLFLVWPRYSDVNLTFKLDNFQLFDDFNYSLTVNGKEFSGKAVSGASKISLPKGELSFKTISLNIYEYKVKDYEFAKDITVILKEKIRDVGISLYLYNNDGTLFNKSANLSFSCNSSNVNLDDKVITNGYLEMVVPSNCGRLNISAQSDGYNLTKGQTCDSYSCSLELSPITQNFSGTNTLPSGALKIKVLDELGNPISGANVSIFDVLDSQYAIDTGLTNMTGLTKTFNSLTVGKYNVYVSYSGYMAKTISADVVENNVVEVNVSISKSALGTVNLNIVDEKNKKLAGNLIVKDVNGLVIYREATSSGTIQMPVYSYSKFYLDFEPNDKNYFPLTNYVLELNANTKNATILVKKTSNYESAKIMIRVVDEDSNPVEGARIFLVDELTQFDLLSYTIPNTDSNGKSNFILQEGLYKLRAYNGFSEAYSNSFAVTKRESGDIPEINVEIQMVFGYSTFDLEVLDQYNTNKIGAAINFYKKPNVFEGSKLTDSEGKVLSFFKAGSKMHYSVNMENYMPYYSESRLLLTNYTWNDKILLEPIKKDGSPRVKFLGVFEEIGKEDVKTMSIGGTYYLGLEFAVYNVNKSIELDFSVGNSDTVEKEKLYVIEAFSSANLETKYSSFNNENDFNVTLGDARVVHSNWTKASKGVYRVYYKVKARDNSSVKLYDPLNISWELKVDDASKVKERKEFLVGSKVLCYPNSFCGRYTLLDVDSDLYVNAYDNSFTVNAGKKYSLNFDLINGISGVAGEINSGYMQIYNALSPDEGFATVKNSIAERSFLELLEYNLEYNDTNKNSKQNLYGIFEERFNLNNFFQNRYVSGYLDFRPISSSKSYMNFLIIDDDKKVVVTGNPAMSILFDSISQKELKVSFFPDKVLAPQSNQSVKVIVKDDSDSFVSDAIVSFRLKAPRDTTYKIYNNCKNLSTNELGEVDCSLNAGDLLPGTYIQILVQKEGFNGYGKTDFKPDLVVSDKIFDFDVEKLEASLSYPSITEMFRDLGIINNTAKTIILDSSELKFSNYSQDVSSFLNYDEMQNYIRESYSNKEILGRELFDEFEYPDFEAKTTLRNYFKAAMHDDIAKDLDFDTYVNGFVTLSFKTDEDNFKRVIPFTVNLVADGFPSNSNCFSLALNGNKTSYASDNGKAIPINFEFMNRCNIELENNVNTSLIPVEFDGLYAVLTYKNGSLSLGNYVFSMNNNSDNLNFSIPKSITSNFSSQDIINPTLTFTPSGTYGKQEVSLKLFGTVKTSQGIKKVESNEVNFDVSVININDCIKVFHNEKELGTLDLTPDLFKDVDYTAHNVRKSGDEFSLTFKNVCNVPLDVSICKDSQGNISSGCGELHTLTTKVCSNDSSQTCNSDENCNGTNGDENECIDKVNHASYVGFTYEGYGDDVGSYTIEDLVDSRDVKVYRPSVSGAYALEIYVKQTNDIGYRRTKFIPVNVKTTHDNALYSDMPFLDVFDVKANNSSDQTIKTSDVLRIYNTDVPGDNRITNKSVFISLLKAKAENKDKPIKIGTIDDLFSTFDDSRGKPKGIDSYGEGMITSTVLGTISGALGASLLTAAIVAAKAASTAAAAAAAATTATTASIAGASEAAVIGVLGVSSPVGWFVSGAILLAMGIAFLATISIPKITDNQESHYLIIEDLKEDLEIVDFSNDIHYSNVNYDFIFGFTGQEQYSYKIVKERVYGGTGASAKTWTDRLNFTVTCDGDYVVDPNSVMWLTEADNAPDTDFEACWWEKVPTITEKSVTFHPGCGGEIYSDPKLTTYVAVGCKLKPELWSRVTLGGPKGPANVGKADVQFENINYNNFPQGPCNEEWCFKIYPLQVDMDFLGNPYKSAFRVAFKNPKKDEVEYENLGVPCMNSNGDVIGFTGKDAMPKVKYNWQILDENFCSPDENNNPKTYCDSTQFLISALKRLNMANNEINKLEDLNCPYMPPIDRISPEANINFKDYEVEFNIDNDTNDVYLSLIKTETLPYADELGYTMTALYDNESIDFNVESTYVNVDTGYKRITRFISKNPIYTLPELDNIKYGDLVLSDKQIAFFVNNNSNNLESFNGNIKFKSFRFPGGCLTTNPSTCVLANGNMELYEWYDEDKNKELLEIHELLHYKAYLMNDGFSKDFMNDFVESILDVDFLNDYSSLLKNLDIEKKIKDNRFKIKNVNPLKENETSGPGEYAININVVYGAFNTKIEDANIEIEIRRLNRAENDNVFYYIPLDSRLGLEGESNLDRVGYGTELKGSNITFDNSITNQTLIGAYDSSSSPKATLNISKDLSFEELNTTERGTVLTIKRLRDNEFDLRFAENLSYKNFDYNVKNTQEDVDISIIHNSHITGFTPPTQEDVDISIIHNIRYGSKKYNIPLPWTIIPNDKDIGDFTGNNMQQTIFSQKIDNKYGLVFPKINVTESSKIELKTRIYGDSKYLKDSDIELTKRNVNVEENNSNVTNFNFDNIQNVLDGINNEQLCISKSSNIDSIRIFVNEKFSILE